MNKVRLKEIIEITLGVVIISFGFYFFLLPISMVIGGVMGFAVILRDYIPVSLFMYITNIILLFIGLIFLGKEFFFKTIYATLLAPTIILVLELTVANDFFMKFMTESPLLAGAVFGGLFIGTGLGIVLRNNGTTGGVDVIQKLMVVYLKIPFSLAMYIIDGLVIFIAMLIDFQLGLYAVGAMIISGMLVDRISVEGRPGFTAFIITDNTEKMRKEIYKRLKRGVTKLRIVGGFSNLEKDMILCTVNKRQIYQFKLIIKKVDPKAFTFVTRTKEVLGEGFSREAAKWGTKD